MEIKENEILQKVIKYLDDMDLPITSYRVLLMELAKDSNCVITYRNRDSIYEYKGTKFTSLYEATQYFLSLGFRVEHLEDKDLIENPQDNITNMGARENLLITDFNGRHAILFYDTRECLYELNLFSN